MRRKGADVEKWTTYYSAQSGRTLVCLLAVLSMGACNSATEAQDTTDLNRYPLLFYKIRVESGDMRYLFMDAEALRADEHGEDDGATTDLVLTQDEVDDVLALFTEDLASIYEVDTIQNLEANEASPPDCDEPTDAETLRVCQALELADPRLTVIFRLGSLDRGPRSDPYLVLEAPTLLSIESADMILHVEELRARVLAEGVPRAP